LCCGIESLAPGGAPFSFNRRFEQKNEISNPLDPVVRDLVGFAQIRGISVL
jgi:hypothetical protein